MFPDTLELVIEQAGILMGRYPLRVYRTRFWPDTGPLEKYRFHFGWPKEIVEPFVLMLETTLYWGTSHWKEDGNFWIWATHVCEKETPWEKLNKELDFKIRQFNQCLHFYKRASRRE